MFFKSCVAFVLSNCLNTKKIHFRIWYTQYIIALSVHTQPNVFNTPYTIQSRMNCPNNYPFVILICLQPFCKPHLFAILLRRLFAHNLFVSTTQRRYLYTQLYTSLTELLMTRCPLCVVSLYIHVFRIFSK